MVRKPRYSPPPPALHPRKKGVKSQVAMIGGQTTAVEPALPAPKRSSEPPVLFFKKKVIGKDIEPGGGDFGCTGEQTRGRRGSGFFYRFRSKRRGAVEQTAERSDRRPEPQEKRNRRREGNLGSPTPKFFTASLRGGAGRVAAPTPAAGGSRVRALHGRPAVSALSTRVVWPVTATQARSTGRKYDQSHGPKAEARKRCSARPKASASFVGVRNVVGC